MATKTPCGLQPTLRSPHRHSGPSRNGLKDEVVDAVHDGEGGEGLVVHDAPPILDTAVADHLSSARAHRVKETTEPSMTATQAPLFANFSEHGEKIFD